MCKALEDIRLEGIEIGHDQGLSEGIQQGLNEGIQAMILDYQEEGFSNDKILAKLQKRFSLSQSQAEEYLYQTTKTFGA